MTVMTDFNWSDKKMNKKLLAFSMNVTQDELIHLTELIDSIKSNRKFDELSLQKQVNIANELLNQAWEDALHNSIDAVDTESDEFLQLFNDKLKQLIINNLDYYEQKAITASCLNKRYTRLKKCADSIDEIRSFLNIDALAEAVEEKIKTEFFGPDASPESVDITGIKSAIADAVMDMINDYIYPDKSCDTNDCLAEVISCLTNIIITNLL